jgi:hypothetical protein
VTDTLKALLFANIPPAKTEKELPPKLDLLVTEMPSHNVANPSILAVKPTENVPEVVRSDPTFNVPPRDPISSIEKPEANTRPDAALTQLDRLRDPLLETSRPINMKLLTDNWLPNKAESRTLDLLLTLKFWLTDKLLPRIPLYLTDIESSMANEFLIVEISAEFKVASPNTLKTPPNRVKRRTDKLLPK